MTVNSGSSMLAAVAAAAALSTALTPAAYAELTIEGVRANRPDLLTAIENGRNVTPLLDAARVEGAKLEGARISGIYAKGKLLGGHDELVQAMIADGLTTPDQASTRLLEANAATLGKRAQGLKDAETALKGGNGLNAAPSAGVAAAATSVAQTPEGWKAEYAASAALQAEFGSEAGYLGFKKAEAGGKVRILTGRAEKQADKTAA